ncbi:MAG TPA: cell division protein FtsA [Candidatus Hydrogenedentes bacterium]|nr:cell division protein FtsA [Candidatus Hydrogenedentota bacterium]
MTARTRETGILAVDFGSSAVRVAVASVAPRGEIQVLYMGEAPTNGAIENGIIQDRRNAADVFSRAVHSALGRTGHKPTAVFATASFLEKRSVIKDGRVQIRDGVVTGDLLEDARESAKQQCIEPAMCCLRSVTAEEWQIDDQRVLNPVGMHGNVLRTRLHFAQIPMMAVENIRALVESAGFQLEDLVFSPIAAALGCVTDEDKAMGTAVVDLGLKHTGLALYQGRSLQGACDADMGIELIIADLMAVTSCHEKEARNLLFEYGLTHARPETDDDTFDPAIHAVDDLPSLRRQPMDNTAVKIHSGNREIDRATISAIISARLEEILLKVLSSVLNDSAQRMSLNRGIILTGGGANIPRLADYVAARYRLPVRLGLPQEIQGWLPSLQTPTYTPLAGVIVHAARYEKDRADGLIGSPDQAHARNALSRLVKWIGNFF